ncbi:MAG TPA: GNAT family N-acetyltransferase [Gaiellales bacterium]|nr:GNAT family N-acetyltransferase [Gaiellales bacterium]
MTGLTVRPARPTEYDALGDLTVAAYRSVPGDDHISPSYEQTLRDVAARAHDAVVLAAVDDDGTILGGVTYVPGQGPLAELERDGDAGIRMLAVSPAAHRRGVGRNLVAACIARAGAEGRSRIVLHTAASMTAAQALYMRFGFVRAPHLDGLVPAANLMAYTLDLNRG